MSWIYTLMLICAVFTCSSTNSSENNVRKQEDIYKGLFRIKHSEQLKMVKQIISKADYAKQYKLVQILIDGMIKVMGESKVLLENSGYVPGGEFPVKEDVKEALSLVLENTVLFSEILLRLPDITHTHLKKVMHFNSLFKWGIIFCNETNLIDEVTQKLLSLAAQELDLVPRDPNYINPYKYKPVPKKQYAEPVKPKKKKTRTKGPQMSNSKLEL